MSGDIHFLLGEIKGKLDGMAIEQERQGAQLSSIEARVGKLEVSGAKQGFVSGSFAAIGIALLQETLKNKIGI